MTLQYADGGDQSRVQRIRHRCVGAESLGVPLPFDVVQNVDDEVDGARVDGGVLWCCRYGVLLGACPRISYAALQSCMRRIAERSHR